VRVIALGVKVMEASTPWLSLVMRESRKIVSFLAFTIKRRVELLPQSSAATTSVTDVNSNEFGHGDFTRHERADGVIGADQVVGQMCVQALDAGPRAADASTGLCAVAPNRGHDPALLVDIMSSRECFGIDESFESMDPAAPFDAAHRRVQFGIDQPVQRGHGRAVT
jgi:hypothetical protein